jgi:hypothetical protein
VDVTAEVPAGARAGVTPGVTAGVTAGVAAGVTAGVTAGADGIMTFREGPDGNEEGRKANLKEAEGRDSKIEANVAEISTCDRQGIQVCSQYLYTTLLTACSLVDSIVAPPR